MSMEEILTGPEPSPTRPLTGYPRRTARTVATSRFASLRALPARLLAWWRALEPPERVLYRAMALLAIGCGLVTPALAFIVPGVLLALVFFGFSFRRGVDG